MRAAGRGSLSRGLQFRVWLSDWRNLLVLLLVLVTPVILTLAVAAVIDSIQARHDATSALRDTVEQGLDIREAQSRRIDGLVVAGERNAERIGELTEEVRVLSAQIERMGGRPLAGSADPPQAVPPVPVQPDPPPPGPPPEEPPPGSPPGDPEPPPEEPPDEPPDGGLVCLPLVGCIG